MHLEGHTYGFFSQGIQKKLESHRETLPAMLWDRLSKLSVDGFRNQFDSLLSDIDGPIFQGISGCYF